MYIQAAFSTIRFITFRTLVFLFNVITIMGLDVASKTVFVEEAFITEVANISNAFVASGIMTFKISHSVKSLITLVTFHFEIFYMTGFVVSEQLLLVELLPAGFTGEDFRIWGMGRLKMLLEGFHTSETFITDFARLRKNPTLLFANFLQIILTSEKINS